MSLLLAAGFERALKRAGVPVIGVSIGANDRRESWRIHYDATVTDAHRDSGEALRASYDVESDQALKDEIARDHLDSQKAAVAVALWVAGKLNIPAAQARAEVLAMMKAL